MNQIVLGLTVVGFVFASVMMILVVLVQRPQGGGLSDAFGAGAGGGGTAFGAKTGDALTTATIGIFILFLALAISLNFLIRPPGATPQASVGGAPGAAQQTPANTATPVNAGEPVTATDEAGNAVELTPIESPEAFLRQQAEQQNATPETEEPQTDEPVDTPEDPQQ